MIKKTFIYLFIFGIIILLYSYFVGTKGLFIREYPIINEKIPNNFNGFKIVHFTDLHYGTTYHKKELTNLINEINELKPDLVVFTGDLLDQRTPISKEEENDLIEGLNKIESTIGNYIISGNHDINPSYKEITNNINFKLLDNTNELIYYKENSPILLVGLSDYLNFKMDIDSAFNYDKENNYYTILLTHEPDVIDRLNDQKIDLVLSGHSHNGQVRLPFIGKIYTPEGSLKYYDAKYELNNTEMYISGGLGTSLAPLRLFCHPSFNFYRLYNQ